MTIHQPEIGVAGGGMLLNGSQDEKSLKNIPSNNTSDTLKACNILMKLRISVPVNVNKVYLYQVLNFLQQSKINLQSYLKTIQYLSSNQDSLNTFQLLLRIMQRSNNPEQFRQILLKFFKNFNHQIEKNFRDQHLNQGDYTYDYMKGLNVLTYSFIKKFLELLSSVTNNEEIITIKTLMQIIHEMISIESGINEKTLKAYRYQFGISRDVIEYALLDKENLVPYKNLYRQSQILDELDLLLNDFIRLSSYEEVRYYIFNYYVASNHNQNVRNTKRQIRTTQRAIIENKTSIVSTTQTRSSSQSSYEQQSFNDQLLGFQRQRVAVVTERNSNQLYPRNIILNLDEDFDNEDYHIFLAELEDDLRR